MSAGLNDLNFAYPRFIHRPGRHKLHQDGATPNTNKYNNQGKIDFSLTILMFMEFFTTILPVMILAILICLFNSSLQYL